MINPPSNFSLTIFCLTLFYSWWTRNVFINADECNSNYHLINVGTPISWALPHWYHLTTFSAISSRGAHWLSFSLQTSHSRSTHHAGFSSQARAQAMISVDFVSGHPSVTKTTYYCPRSMGMSQNSFFVYFTGQLQYNSYPLHSVSETFVRS